MQYYYDVEELVNALTYLENNGIFEVKVMFQQYGIETQYLRFESDKMRRTVKAGAYYDALEDFIKKGD